MKPRSLGGYLLLTGLTVALLAPFLGKAFHIDDPLFIWTARQVQAHPGDPYGFPVNWYERIDPMFTVTQNPPLASYYLALAAALVGWSEPALHAAMLLPAVGAVLGVYRLARRFCVRPALAALVTLACPVFLISSTTVMCDTLMLCLWVWAIVLWVEGLDAGPGWFAAAAPVAAGVLIALAALTKYFGVSLIPLLLVYALVRRRYPPLLALLIPVAALIAYQVWTGHLYGHGLLSQPLNYSHAARQYYARPGLLTVFNLLSFAGGCLLPALLLYPTLVLRPWRWLAVLVFLLALLGLAHGQFGDMMALNNNGRLNYPLAVQLAIFVVGGLAILILTIQDLAQRRDADALLLCLWIVGTLAFTGLFNWSINGRSILPMAPAVGILLVRRWEAREVVGSGGFRTLYPPRGSGAPAACSGGNGGFVTPRKGNSEARSALPTLREWDWRWLAVLGFSVLIGLAGAWTDESVANANRDAALDIAKKYSHAAGRLWFEGHWGFQYYMENQRAVPMLDGYLGMKPGDILAVACNNSNIRPLPQTQFKLREEFVRPVMPWMSVHSGFRGAGFYADVWGSAPYVLGPSMNEQYTIVEVTQRPQTAPNPEVWATPTR